MRHSTYLPPSFWRYHLAYPLLLLFVTLIVIQLLELDRQLATWLYQLEGHQWSLQKYWVTNQLLHKDGKYLSEAVATFFLLLLIRSVYIAELQHYKPVFLFILSAAALSTLIVSVLKYALAVSCPWDFDIFGGHTPYIPLWQQLWVRNGEGCFPAGHASAAYSWICLYFVGMYYRAPWRWWALVSVLLLGIAFGGAQQLRGAHFISHDLFTLAICWLVSLILFLGFLKYQSSPIENNE